MIITLITWSDHILYRDLSWDGDYPQWFNGQKIKGQVKLSAYGKLIKCLKGFYFPVLLEITGLHTNIDSSIYFRSMVNSEIGKWSLGHKWFSLSSWFTMHVYIPVKKKDDTYFTIHYIDLCPPPPLQLCLVGWRGGGILSQLGQF